MHHDARECDLGHALGKRRVEFAFIEILTRDNAKLGELGNHRCIRLTRRVSFQELGKEGEVFNGIHAIDLLANGSLHIDGRIDFTLGRCPVLAPGA
ncbi:hypothetical protein D3C86_1911630 [compost metagenome]